MKYELKHNYTDEERKILINLIKQIRFINTNELMIQGDDEIYHSIFRKSIEIEDGDGWTLISPFINYEFKSIPDTTILKVNHRFIEHIDLISSLL